MNNRSFAGNWDEPLPGLEFDPGLQQPTHTGLQDGPDDKSWSRNLRVHGFVSQVPGATDSQKKRIASLLERRKGKSFTTWMAWIERQNWTGSSLLLLLEFWLLWERSPKWWESYYWDKRLKMWIPGVRSTYTLSKDNLYRLVQLRSGCRSHDVIGADWLSHWESERLYECGFPTFASFGVFRAGFKPGENWRSHVRRDTEDYQFYDDDFVDGEYGYRYDDWYR